MWFATRPYSPVVSSLNSIIRSWIHEWINTWWSQNPHDPITRIRSTSWGPCILHTSLYEGKHSKSFYRNFIEAVIPLKSKLRLYDWMLFNHLYSGLHFGYWPDSLAIVGAVAFPKFFGYFESLHVSGVYCKLLLFFSWGFYVIRYTVPSRTDYKSTMDGNCGLSNQPSLHLSRISSKSCFVLCPTWLVGLRHSCFSGISTISWSSSFIFTSHTSSWGFQLHLIVAY